ncbi:MAG: Stp1/IreP family PP2C-type Ser/Thr phosphatase [Lachnospiraceae bacterium]|nr:Stp1/IreP family PP2C-type Ser/Thr phosphatase [Lachnospiraceae bacterium]
MKAYAITDIGRKRSLNQDYAYMTLEPVGKLPNLFIVADGMGGHNGGGYASRMAVETILSEVMEAKEEDISDILVRAIRCANDTIKKTANEDERLFGMGTTVVAAVCKGNTLTVANVGDSRLYITNDREIRQITQDHSLVEEMVRFGGISKEQARKHPDKNIITRAVGVEDDLKVDCFLTVLEQKDKVLLCSDGLTNMLEDEQIRQMAESEGSVEQRVCALVAAANDNGGKDNIAVIILEPFSDEVSR